MKKFIALYICANESKKHLAWKELSSTEQKSRMEKGTEAHKKWLTKYKDQIVFENTSLGKMTKKIDSNGIVDLPSQMGAFVIISASSHEEASEMFKAHPHFTYFPGDAIEVIELLN